jgi:hypothetical protein
LGTVLSILRLSPESFALAPRGQLQDPQFHKARPKKLGFFYSRNLNMTNAVQHSIEALAIGASNKATIAGGATAVVTGSAVKAGFLTTAAGTFDIAAFCALGGLALAMLGYFTSLYFQARRDRREAAAFRLKHKQDV